MHYLTAVQLLTPERTRRPDRCHCAWPLWSSKDSIRAEETCLISAVTSEPRTATQKCRLHTHADVQRSRGRALYADTAALSW